MNVLAHVHAFNDSSVIDRALQALLDQTYPLQQILLVDNGSTDSTLQRSFPSAVRVIRRPTNLGPSGACTTGFQYAMAHGYDWMWVLDADSVPRRDALRKLVELYDSFDSQAKSEIGVLSCSHLLVPSL